MKYTAYIGLGSNLGDRRAMIMTAVDKLRATPGILDVHLSGLNETEPVGGPRDQGLFLNAAARVETTLPAMELLNVMQAIEKDLGRVRQGHWGPRTIDLDLLLFDDQVIDLPGLEVPHPRMHERRFVLAPLAEIAGEVIHPILNKTIKDLLNSLPK